MTDPRRSVQDYYPEDFSHCYGCGRLNAAGLHLCTEADGEETITVFTPGPQHIAVPGFVYGGLIASLIDCHAMATAAAAAERAAGREIGDAPSPRYVTASLHIDFRQPTPLGPELTLRGRVRSAGERKAVVEVRLLAEGRVTVDAEVIAVRMPDSMKRKPRP